MQNGAGQMQIAQGYKIWDAGHRYVTVVMVNVIVRVSNLKESLYFPHQKNKNDGVFNCATNTCIYKKMRV